MCAPFLFSELELNKRKIRKYLIKMKQNRCISMAWVMFIP